jgi:hypothetical protein
MALQHLTLDQIDEAQLQRLIDGKASETRDIEYKRDRYGDADKDYGEYLADISSFANTAGGDIIIGMTTEAGVPTGFAPLQIDRDAEILRLENSARSGLQPRIFGLAIRGVLLATGGFALVVRIPRSYNQPHRIVRNGPGHHRFYARSSAGKYEPNVDELRAMFTRAPQLAERMRDFRLERTARIASGDTPVPLQDECCLVLHVVPFSAFDLRPPFSLETAIGRAHRFSPMGLLSVQNWRINFDGFLTLSNWGTKATKQRAYVQMFRTGAIEAVATSILREEVLGEKGPINVQQLDAMIVQSTCIYSTLLHECGAEPPLAVMVSLIGVKNRDLVAGFASWSYTPETAVIDRDQLHCAEVILEDVPSEDPDCAKKLRQALDQLANAAGRSSSASFDQSGTFLLGQGGHLPR